MKRTPAPSVRLLSVAAALLLLNQALAFSSWWPTPAIVPDHRLAPEFLWLWLILLGIGFRRGTLPGRWLIALSAFYVALVLGRYLDVTAPSLFGRPINLYWDVPQVPRFLWVAAQDLPLWASVAALSATVLALWALYRMVRWAIATTSRVAVPYALQSRVILTITGAAVVLVTLNYAGVKATWPLVSKPVIPTYVRQGKIFLTTLSPERMAEVLPPSTLLDKALASPRQALAGLRDRDVYLMPLESYGAVTYDHADAEAFRALRARFAADIAAGGLHVVSAFLRAPTFGGASDLSHLSMLSGIDLTDPLRHDLLLTTRRPTLINLFKAAGYQTFGVYPALFWEWPEREYYGFENFIDGPMLQYRGPPMGYWSIPDQYAFARFESMYSRPAHPGEVPPRFVFMPTISTHFPFNPLPPFQPERERLLSSQPFDPDEVKAALTEKIDWLDMAPAYRRMIDYQWRWIGDWLRRPQPRDTLFILVGDHQPTANISGEGASWDVPIHILANDPALLAAFVSQGFTAGMEPPRQPLGGMHELPALLLGVTAR